MRWFCTNETSLEPPPFASRYLSAPTRCSIYDIRAVGSAITRGSSCMHLQIRRGYLWLHYTGCSPRIKLSTCYSKGIAFYRAPTAVTHTYYRVSILSCGIRSLPRYISIGCCSEMRFWNKNDTMLTRDNYGDSQDFEILIQYSRSGGSSGWKSWRNIPAEQVARRGVARDAWKNARVIPTRHKSISH